MIFIYDIENDEFENYSLLETTGYKVFSMAYNELSQKYTFMGCTIDESFGFKIHSIYESLIDHDDIQSSDITMSNMSTTYTTLSNGSTLTFTSPNIFTLSFFSIPEPSVTKQIDADSLIVGDVQFNFDTENGTELQSLDEGWTK